MGESSYWDSNAKRYQVRDRSVCPFTQEGAWAILFQEMTTMHLAEVLYWNRADFETVCC